MATLQLHLRIPYQVVCMIKILTSDLVGRRVRLQDCEAVDNLFALKSRIDKRQFFRRPNLIDF